MIMETIRWNTEFPATVVISLAVMLLLLFGWLEWQRPLRYRVLRLMALIFAVASLALMILHPAVPTVFSPKPILLLTPGYEKSKADSLIQQYDLQLYRLAEADPFQGAAVLSWGEISSQAERIQFVVGDGLPPFMKSQRDLHFDFISGKPEVGITRWNVGKAMVNRSVTITGELSMDGQSMVVLKGPGGPEDSVAVQDAQPFTLHFKPKNAGKYLYIVDVRNKTNPEQETFPVVVHPERKINILVSLTFPTFETRQLKSYLSDKGHALSVRYEVSRKVFRTEFINADRSNLTVLTPQLLQAMDVLIATPATLEGLSMTEWNSLKEATYNGLGLILLLDGPLPLPARTRALIPAEFNPMEKDTVDLTFPWSGRSKTVKAPALQMAKGQHMEVLQTDHEGSPLTGYAFSGSGKIGFQLLPATYRLALEGQLEDYSNLWVPLFDAVAREASKPFDITLASSPPYYPDEPIRVDVVSADGVPELSSDGIPVPLEEDLVINDVWHGVVVADEGWHTLMTQDSSVLPYFISRRPAWHATRAEYQKQINKGFGPRKESGLQSQKVYSEISPLLFFLTFLLSAGFLWLAPKI